MIGAGFRCDYCGRNEVLHARRPGIDGPDGWYRLASMGDAAHRAPLIDKHYCSLACVQDYSQKVLSE